MCVSRPPRTRKADQDVGHDRRELRRLTGAVRLGDTNRIEVAVRVTLVAVFEQRIWGSVFASPLLHWLAIEGINSQTLTFATPESYTPKLSGVIYMMRILLVCHALPEDRKLNETGSADAARDGGDSLALCAGSANLPTLLALQNKEELLQKLEPYSKDLNPLHLIRVRQSMPIEHGDNRLCSTKCSFGSFMGNKKKNLHFC